MVDIFGRSSQPKKKTTTDLDLSKYATKDEVDNLLNLASVDPEEVAVFQDRQGKLKSSNIKWVEIVRRVFGAIPGNFAEFTDTGKIRDSNISIKNINDKIEKCLKKGGDVMTGELNLNGNRITVLRNPDGDEDAANKKYVDTGDAVVDNKVSTLRAEYDAHVTQFGNFRKNQFQKLLKTAEEFFGDPRVVDMKLGDIKQKLDDIEDGIPNISTKVLMIKVSAPITHDDVRNIVVVLKTGQATWTPKNNIIEHTAKVTGIYRLTVISATQFTVGTTSMLRVTTGDNTSTGIVSVVLNSGANETFTLTPVVSGGLRTASYHYCLEFVAETSQLVTA